MEASLVTIAAKAGCQLAENPLWHPDERCLYWTDIPAGKIYRFDNVTHKFSVVYDGDPVGGFTFQQDGGLLLFRVNDIAQMKPDGRITSFRRFSEAGMERFNDVIADPEGRVFAGTYGEHPKCGVYRVDLDGTITKLFAGTGCSNGMGFSLNHKTFYWTCSSTRHIFQFDYDHATGAIANRKIFYHASAGEGIPDGLAVDSEGCVWSARWGKASVVRHDTEGRVLDSITLPATNITSVCFGGEHLDRLFITSAQEGGKRNDSAGSVFQIDLSIRGTSEFTSRVGLV